MRSDMHCNFEIEDAVRSLGQELSSVSFHS